MGEDDTFGVSGGTRGVVYCDCIGAERGVVWAGVLDSEFFHVGKGI